MLDQPRVEVLATQVGVSRGGEHFEDSGVDREQRDVKGAAAQVEDQHRLRRMRPIEPKGDRRRRRLIEDAKHVEAGDRARVFCRLPLRVVEVGGHRHDHVLHLLAEVGLGSVAHLTEHHRRHLLWRKRLFGAVDSHLNERLATAVRDDLEWP